MESAWLLLDELHHYPFISSEVKTSFIKFIQDFFHLQTMNEKKEHLVYFLHLFNEQKKARPDNCQKEDEFLYLLESVLEPYLVNSYPISNLRRAKMVEELYPKSRKVEEAIRDFCPKAVNVLQLLIDLSNKREYTMGEFKYIMYVYNTWYLFMLDIEDSEEMIRFLLLINANNLNAVLWISEKLKEDLQKVSDPFLQLNLLDKYKKMYKITSICQFTEKESYPSLSYWLEEDLNSRRLECEEKKNQLFKEKENFTIESKEKIHTSLSVSELACLLKTLIDAQFITDKDTSEVIDVFTKVFTSKRINDISVHSFKNKFYNIEKQTIDSLMSMYSELMSQLKKY